MCVGRGCLEPDHCPGGELSWPQAMCLPPERSEGLGVGHAVHCPSVSLRAVAETLSLVGMGLYVTRLVISNEPEVLQWVVGVTSVRWGQAEVTQEETHFLLF